MYNLNDLCNFISYRSSKWLIKSSKLVVNLVYSVIYRGISMLFRADSDTAVAQKSILIIKHPHFRRGIIPRVPKDCYLSGPGFPSLDF